MEANDTTLLRELSRDMQSMSGTVTRLATLIEEWTPTWRAQGDGLVDLVNRQTKLEGRLDMIAQQFESDKKYRETLESLAAKGAEERRAQLQWTIGIGISIITLLIAGFTFIIQHISIK